MIPPPPLSTLFPYTTLFRSRSNLVILRTLSKAAALAGARVGYLIADPALVAEVSKVYPPYAVNLFARAAALATLARPELLAERAAKIVAERDRVFPALSSAGGA